MSLFHDVPKWVNFEEKDDAVFLVCIRCGKTKALNGDISITSAIKFARQFHTDCKIKADLVEVENG